MAIRVGGFLSARRVGILEALVVYGNLTLQHPGMR
jgi:hypothetical protein